MTLVLPVNAKEKSRGFAIVVDPESYSKAKTEIDAYAVAIENDGLKVYIVVDKWQKPDSIRNELIRLYNQGTAPIEGAVFIGNIPIAFIRNAQYLTSAFKMDQEKFEWSRSSVPSDRFYDDFDLQFEYLKKDSTNPNYFYYNLKPRSVQRLQSEIYTGRIKPFETADKYEKLKSYLKKVVRIKSESNPLDQVLYFGGHGYNSESTMARVDEKISLLEQFPWLKKQKNGLEYIDHQMDVFIKPRLLSELQRNDLDFALLHHHGDTDIEYLNGTPKVDDTKQQIEGVQFYLRSKLRSAKEHGKDTAVIIKEYSNKFGVPPSWFNGSFTKEIIEKDSIFNENLDIHITDIQNATPNARFIVLDACFNGSFHLDKYLAGTYIFNDGNTIAVQANSVNALQDKWANQYLGLLGLGLRVGSWSKLTGYLESHIIGDPTFHFQPIDNKININDALIQQKTNAKYWISQLNSVYPDVQTLALQTLYNNNYPDLSNLLLKTFKESPYGIVRMESLKLLTAYNDNNFIEALNLAINDSYELVQRQAVYLIGKSGDARLIPALISVAIRNNTSERIEYNIKEALAFFPEEGLLKEFEKQFAATEHYVNKDTVKKAIAGSLSYNSKRWADDAAKIFDPKETVKHTKSGIKALRNYNYHPTVEGFIRFAKENENEELQLTMIEALGWFNISYKKDLILKACEEIAKNPKYSPKVRDESLRTINRLKIGWYR